MIKDNKTIRRIVAVSIACIAMAASGYAQNLQKGDMEATGQVGLVTGIGTHASLAGSAGGGVTDRIFAFGEFGWIPTGGVNASTTTPGGTFNLEASGHILTFMGGAHYQFSETRSWIPYAGGALGLVHGSQSVTETSGGVTTRSHVTTNNLYVSFGGGARYYVNEYWGFKPEFMVFAGDNTFFRFGAGVFYTFGR